jgi:HSP20 family protein
MKNSVTTQEKSAVRGESQRPTREESQRPESRRWVQPQVNIIASRDGYTLEAEMPGVGKEGLEVLLEGTELTIVGRRNPAPIQSQPVYRESNDYDYRRTFELDPLIDTGRVVARVENGLLHLELPKTEKVKPRKIAVE